MGVDMDHPPVVFSAMVDQVAIMMDVLQALFDTAGSPLPLGPTIR